MSTKSAPLLFDAGECWTNGFVNPPLFLGARMTKAIWIVSALLAVQGSPYVIDLVVAPRSSDEQYLAVPDAERVDALPPVGFASHAPVPATAPFEVHVTLDRNAYQLGSDFLYEAAIRYTGTTPIMFPVSPQVHLFRKSMPSLRVGKIAISVVDPTAGHQIQTVDALYGSDNVPGTLITMATNEVVTIRGKGNWTLRLQTPFAANVWPLRVSPVVDFSVHGASLSLSTVRATMLDQITLQGGL